MVRTSPSESECNEVGGVLGFSEARLGLFLLLGISTVTVSTSGSVSLSEGFDCSLSNLALDFVFFLPLFLSASFRLLSSLRSSVLVLSLSSSLTLFCFEDF